MTDRDRNWHLWTKLRDGVDPVPPDHGPTVEMLKAGMAPDPTEAERDLDRFGTSPTADEARVIAWKRAQVPPEPLTFREALIVAHGRGHHQMLGRRCSQC